MSVARILYSYKHKTWKHVLLKDTESQNHSGGKRPGAGGLSSYLLPRAGWDTNSDQLLGLYLVMS